MTFCGEPAALSATESEAAYAPAAVGLNEREIEQFMPAGKVVPHVVVCLNAAEFIPAMLMPEIVSVAVPGFCIEIERVLDAPTARLGKATEDDEKETSGASGATEKFNEFDVPPPGAGLVTVTTAVPAFATRWLAAANYGPGGTQSVNLFGNGLIVSDLKVSPFQIDFIWAVQGFPANAAAVTLTNTSAKLLTGLKFTIDSSSYKQTHTCATSLAPGASCTVNITFTPAILGTIPGTLSIQHSGVGSPQLVHMTGMGVTALSITPNPLVAPPQVVGTANNTLGLGIGNGSGYPSAVTLSSIKVQGTDFKLARTSVQRSSIAL